MVSWVGPRLEGDKVGEDAVGKCSLRGVSKAVPINGSRKKQKEKKELEDE